MKLWSGLVRAGSWSLLGTAVRVAAGLATIKIVAAWVGPAGVAAVGAMQNVVSVATTLGSGGVANGVVRYTAEFAGDEERSRGFWRSARALQWLTTLATVALLAGAAVVLPELLVGVEGAMLHVALVALTLPVTVFQNFVLSVLNGRGDVRRLTIATMLVPIAGALLTLALVPALGLLGATLAQALYQPLVTPLIVWLLRRAEWIRDVPRWTLPRTDGARLLAGYGLMALASAVTGPAAQLAIRALVTDEVSTDAAGYVQAVWRLSDSYLMVITSAFVMYHLPRLSVLQGARALWPEMLRGALFAFTVAALAGGLVLLLRDVLVPLLFSERFLPMRELLPMQVVGDVFKAASFAFAYLFVAKGMTRTFILAELAFAASFVGLAAMLVPRHGAAGVTLAHALNYAGYLAFCVAAVYFALRAPQARGSRGEAS